MKQITIRELRATISTLLKELPFEIIDGKSKKVLAVVFAPKEVVKVQAMGVSTTNQKPHSKEVVWGEPLREKKEPKKISTKSRYTAEW